MDERAAPFLLFGPIVVVVAAYVLAARGKDKKIRKTGNAMAAVMVGLVALFGSWWALGMTIGIWSLDIPEMGPRTLGEVLLALLVQILLLIFPFGAWYFCIRFARAASKEKESN